MPAKIRHYKNQKRGTELTYATLPIEEARNIGGDEVRRELEQFYGQGIDYKWLAKGIHEFAESDKKEKIISMWNKDAKNPYELDSGNWLTLKRLGNRVLFAPTPAVHDLLMGRAKFSRVLKILEEGFEPEGGMGDNACVKKGKNYRFTGWAGHSADEGITRGDTYSFELFADKKSEIRADRGTYRIEKSAPNRILSVNVALNPSSSEEDKEAKMKFYKKGISEKYGVPVRFFEAEGEYKGIKGNETFQMAEIENFKVGKRVKKSLEQKVTSVIAIAGFLGSLIFLQSDITGNAIADLSTNTSSWTGGVLLVVGLVAGFFWIRSKKKKFPKSSKKK